MRHILLLALLALSLSTAAQVRVINTPQPADTTPQLSIMFNNTIPPSQLLIEAGRYRTRAIETVLIGGAVGGVMMTISDPEGSTNWQLLGAGVITASAIKLTAHRALREVEEKTAAIGRIFDTAHLEQRIPTRADLQTALGKKAQEPKPSGHNLQAALTEFRTEQRNGWSVGTFKRFGVIASHLKTWRPEATVEELDRSTLPLYVDYLYSCGLSNTTVAKNISWVRWFLRWCYDKGYTPSADFDRYRPKFKGSDQQREVVYLTEEELRSIIDLDLSTRPALDRTRDVFLFCCFSGLRYSDVAKLRRSDIKGDHIHVVTKKTDDPLDMELNKFTQAILAKYADRHPDDLALPIISNQKTNKDIKELAQLAGIDQPVRKVRWVRSERIETVVPKYQLVTSHCGRRTFIVTALYLEIPSEVIRKWTGQQTALIISAVSIF